MIRKPPLDPVGKEDPGKVDTAMREWLYSIWNDRDRVLPDNATTSLLFAASRLYELGLRRSQARALQRRMSLPAFVVSIGNLVTGGTGKTPVTLFICRFLAEEGFHPAILSRGYRRKGRGAAQVFADGPPWVLSDIFGDEPVLMAMALPEVPVWVGRERVVSGRAALAGNAGVDTLVLDDGFQHLVLDRNLDIVLIDSVNPFGNGFTLPLGPLREPISHLERADALIITRAIPGPHLDRTLSLLQGIFPGKPVFACRHIISGFRPSMSETVSPVGDFEGLRAVAFAGLAEPEKFFDGLSALGIHVRGTFSFPDHYRYTDSDMMRVVESAREWSSEVLVTTEKDAVRVPPAFRKVVTIAEMEIDFGADDARFREFLRKRIGVSGKGQRVERI